MSAATTRDRGELERDDYSVEHSPWVGWRAFHSDGRPISGGSKTEAEAWAAAAEHWADMQDEAGVA